MLKLQDVTLVAMTSVNLTGTIQSLIKSCQGIDFAAVKLITHEPVSNLPGSIQYCPIEQIKSIDDYSYKMIYQLENYIETPYALIVQNDSWVINPTSWREEFYQYDYIGAPFAAPQDDFSYRDANGVIFRVGNGGFSFRSKKLIQLPNQLKLPWQPFHGYYNEDGFICAMNRHIYMENGCQFAPLDIAKYFSHEAEIPEVQGINPFGFHGKWSKYFKK